MKVLVIFSLFLLTLIACSDENAIPKKIIPQTEMQKILWDMLLADRYTSQFIAKDTTKKIKIENLKLYDQVFQLHKVTKTQFVESFEFYLQHPKLTKVMFDSLYAGSNRMRGEVYLTAPDK